MTSQVAIAQAAREKGVLQAADIDAIVEPRIGAAFEALKEMEGQIPIGPQSRTAPTIVPDAGGADLSGIRFRVTPTGIELVRPGGQ